MGEPDPHPGPLSQAVAFATIGRAAVERHAETEAILAYEHALPLAEAAVAAGDGPHEDLVRFLGYVHDVLGGLKLARSDLDGARHHFTTALELSQGLDPASTDVAKFTSNLGSVAREVLEIAEDYGPGARVVTGPVATKDLILKATSGYRVVHFATHGVLDDAEPLYSGLQVAAGRAEGEEGSETLHVYEMFSLHLPAAVVVCSACQTAQGKIRAGEGLVGMSRALFYAGASSLVVTLWPIPDVPTRRLMRVFHRHLRSGHDPAEALSRAKQDVRSSHPHVYRHPYTWAGFIVLGPV